MIKSFFLSKKWALWAWGGFAFIIGSLIAQTWIDVQINEWYKGFYDILQKATDHNVSEFYEKIFFFFKLAIPYVIIWFIIVLYLKHYFLLNNFQFSRIIVGGACTIGFIIFGYMELISQPFRGFSLELLIYIYLNEYFLSFALFSQKKFYQSYFHHSLLIKNLI